MNLLNDENARIKNTEGGLIISVALIIDAIQAGTKLLHFVPLIGNGAALITGWFISFCAWLGFWFWFKLKGVNMMDKAVVAFSTLLIEFVPIINALPGWTFHVSAVIIYTRKEDIKKAMEEKISKKRALKKITKRGFKKLAPQGA